MEARPRLDPMLDALRRGGAGIRAWSIYASESRRVRLGVKDREIGNPHAPLALVEAGGASYVVVWEDGKVSRGQLERRQLECEPDESLRRARAVAYDDPDAAWVLGPSPMPEVALHHPVAARIASGDPGWIARRLAAIRERVGAAGTRTWSCSFGAGEGNARLVTSEGLDVRGEGTSLGWFVSVNGEIGDGFSARRPDDDDAFARRLARLLRLAGELERPVAALAGGVRPVLLHPDVVEAFVLDTLLENLGGAMVAHGDGHFRPEQFGADERVLREDIRLGLDPLRPFGSGSYRFTAEGVPAARCDYILRGRLVRPLLGLKYARRLGLPPTPLPHGADGLVFEGASSIGVDEALAAAEGGAFVLSVLGVHTQDSASGDFSLSAPQALHVASGGFDGRLRPTISGNLFDVLRDGALRFVRFEDEPVPGLLFPCRVDP